MILSEIGVDRSAIISEQLTNAAQTLTGSVSAIQRPVLLVLVPITFGQFLFEPNSTALPVLPVVLLPKLPKLRFL